MDISTELLEKIERYITYQLPDDQRREIELLMKDREEVRRAVDDMRRSRTLIDNAVQLDDATRQDLLQMARGTMNQLEDRYRDSGVKSIDPVQPRRVRAVHWGMIMAALLLLVGGVYLSVTSVQLANADLNAGVHRDARLTPEQDLRPVERQALEDFLEANALYTNGDFKGAATHYEQAAKAPISPYLKQAIWWNLTLSYLKINDVDKARRCWERYDSLEQPNYPSDLIDRVRIRTKLLWRELFV